MQNRNKQSKNSDKSRKLKAKKKLRKILFGSMAMGGAMGMAGMTAQAHGNASSHMEANLSWNFDDFAIQRETIQTTFPDEIEALTNLQRSLDQFENRRINVGNLENIDLASFANLERNQSNQISVAPLTDKLELIKYERFVSNQALNTRYSISSIKERAALTPLTQDVLDLMRIGETQRAIDLIENAASANAALASFSIVQLDLYNFSAVDQLSTSTLTEQILEISRAALEFQSDNAAENIGARAGLLHNMASSTLPDIGEATPRQVGEGRRAAEEALELREQIGEPISVGIAEYLVGVFDFKSGDFQSASDRFESSLANLEYSDRAMDIAWSKLYLGLTQLAMGNENGASLIEEVREEFRAANNTYGLAYLERVSSDFL